MSLSLLLRCRRAVLPVAALLLAVLGIGLLEASVSCRAWQLLIALSAEADGGPSSPTFVPEPTDDALVDPPSSARPDLGGRQTFSSDGPHRQHPALVARITRAPPLA